MSRFPSPVTSPIVTPRELADVVIPAADVPSLNVPWPLLMYLISEVLSGDVCLVCLRWMGSYSLSADPELVKKMSLSPSSSMSAKPEMRHT